MLACREKICEWTEWYDDENGSPISRNATHEIEDIHEILEDNMELCKYVEDIECRDVDDPETQFKDIIGQEVCCDLDDGLVCENLYYEGHPCSNYKVRLFCCRYEPCSETTTPATTTPTPVTTTPTPVTTTNPPTKQTTR